MPVAVVRRQRAARGLVGRVHHGAGVGRVAEAGDVAVLVQVDRLEVERARLRGAAGAPDVARVDRHVGLIGAAGRPRHAERAVLQRRPADVVEAVVALRARALAHERRAARRGAAGLHPVVGVRTPSSRARSVRRARTARPAARAGTVVVLHHREASHFSPVNEYEFSCGGAGGFGAFFAPWPASARSAAAFASCPSGTCTRISTRWSASAFDTPSTAITRSLAAAGPAVASSPVSAMAPAIARFPCFISTSRVELCAGEPSGGGTRRSVPRPRTPRARPRARSA